MKAGILSDTHLNAADPQFRELARRCFSDCEVIIHAGDLTDLSVLEAFADQKVFAVCGNMCRGASRKALNPQETFSLGKFRFGLTHGAGLGPDIEARLWELFPEVDCMIYGHTHRAVSHRINNTLIVNPGSFKSTGPWGAPGTYAILEIGETLRATIQQVPRP